MERHSIFEGKFVRRSVPLWFNLEHFRGHFAFLLTMCVSATYSEAKVNRRLFWNKSIIKFHFGIPGSFCGNMTSNNHVPEPGLANLATDLLPRLGASARMTPLP